MAKWGSVDYRQLKELQERLNRMADGADREKFCKDCANELAQRLFRKVVKRTPTRTTNLKKSWAIKSIEKKGDDYICTIINPAANERGEMYASYVEYGHRTANHSGWVEGQFMLTISEKEIQASAPKIIEKKLQKRLEEMLNGR